LYSTQPSGPVLLVVRDILLRPLLVCELILANLIVAPHCTK